MTPGTALIRPASIEAIVSYRDDAVARLLTAFDTISGALDQIGRAAPNVPYATSLPDAVRDALIGRRGGSPDRERFTKLATQHVDRMTWRELIGMSGLERLMDQKAKAEFHAHIEADPAEATVETCRATMMHLHSQAGEIFRRGLATTFSALDRRFRSHDGFKIGARIVLPWAFNEFGSWNHRTGQDDALRDVERAFYLMDGRQHPEYAASIVGLLASQRPKGFGRSAWRVENDYFDARAFKNGNLHIWFKRDDLVERVNQVLADHYGATLGDGTRAAPTGRGYRAPAKGFDFFRSPPAVASRVIEEAYIRPGMRVLEPSAGDGALAFLAAASEGRVTAIEIQPRLAAELKERAQLAEVMTTDFLDLQPSQTGLFDRIVMNPPFGGRADIEHVHHALSFLKPGGRLVAVVGAGIAYREDRNTVALRERIEAAGGRIAPLPAGSFESSGTNANTCLVTLSLPLS